MDPPLTPADSEITLRIFASVYILWGVLWGLVAFHYGRASQASWREQGGSWKHCLKDFFVPLVFAWQKALSWTKLLKDSSSCHEEEIPARYTVGHYLRFSIFLGAVSPFFLIFTIAQTDRSSWNPFVVLVFSTLLLLSSIGAGGHLFIAYRMIPGNWSRLVVLSTLWLIAAPFLFVYLNWP